jgi:hypothetical protein
MEWGVMHVMSQYLVLVEHLLTQSTGVIESAVGQRQEDVFRVFSIEP